MPPPLLIDFAGLDLDRIELTKQQIYARLPQRHEFEVLDGVCLTDFERRQVVAYADIRPDAWWVRGHVPGRPLLPGVIMLEMAAQTCAVLAKLLGNDSFVAFGGVEACKFRETVVPPSRLYILGAGVDYRSRRIVSDTQGVMDGKLIFEARITGLMLP
jgi:3-hydroxyacyl-[acyl-carrier-protein] dehydratase